MCIVLLIFSVYIIEYKFESDTGRDNQTLDLYCTIKFYNSNLDIQKLCILNSHHAIVNVCDLVKYYHIGIETI